MTDAVAQTQRDRQLRLRVLITALGMLPVLVLLVVGFELLSGRFLTFNNLSIVMQQAAINIVLAAGMTFVILTGGIDLSVGSILAASAMIAAGRACRPTVEPTVTVLEAIVDGPFDGGF